MHWIDWTVILIFVLFFTGVGLYTKRYMQSVADFLAANRCAGRYLLTHASEMAGMGAVWVIAVLQQMNTSGFGAGWWGHLGKPLVLILAMCGWVIYRFRETRVLTIPELFERRYSRNFRFFAALLCWSGGILVFGIYPSVGANFFMHYCGFPPTYSLAGIELSTFHSLVVMLVVVAIYFTSIGGQIAVLVTDFLQSTFCNVILLALLALLLIKFPLADVFDGLKIHEPSKSMLNPFDAGKVDFDPFFFLIGYVGAIMNRIGANTQAYFCSAKTPHDQKMAGILAGFRGIGVMYGLILAALVAYMLMHHPAYSDYGHQATKILSGINSEEVRSQMTVPITMTLYIPIGMMGAFAAVMLAALITTYDTELHSWGSMFIQDLVLPFRKKPITSRQHVLLLRLAIVGVGIFAILFSSFFKQTQHIFFYFALAGSLWLGGSGIVIIGGLYTRWGNTVGAYAGMITGSLIAVSGMVCHQFWPEWYGEKFFLDGQRIFFWAMVSSTFIYTVFSLAFRRGKSFDLDKLLHRGKYSIKEDHNIADTKQHMGLWGKLRQVLGYSPEFTFGDKIIYGISVGQMSLFVGSFVVMTCLHFIFNFTDEGWGNFFRYKLWYYIFAAFAFSLWLGIGGFRDLFQLFKDLKAVKRSAADDGRVTAHDYETPSIGKPFNEGTK